MSELSLQQQNYANLDVNIYEFFFQRRFGLRQKELLNPLNSLFHATGNVSFCNVFDDLSYQEG